jgi:hypothetical protein
MTQPIDATLLPAGVARLLDKGGPPPLRQMAARGIAPGLKPHEALTLVVMLAEAEGDPVRDNAQATLLALPPQLLAGALVPELLPRVLAVIAPQYARDAKVMEKILALPQIETSTVAAVAAKASELVAELVATNEERLLRDPTIIERLYMNKETRMSTADRLLELAVRNGKELTGIPAFKEAALAIQGELIAEPSPEPTYDDVLFRETDELAAKLPIDLSKEDTHRVDPETGEEFVESKWVPVSTKLSEMTVSQKIRRAMLGTPSERMILVRDNNRLVASAAIKSPLIQENEVVRITGSRNVSDEVLGYVARSRDWTRSYTIKMNLIQNPRTPFGFVAKLIPHLRENDLKNVAKSKNVTGAVSTAARQQLQRKGK